MNNVYLLKGNSLKAAERLERLALAYFRANPPLSSGNLADIQKSYAEITENLITFLEEKAPGLLDDTGIKTPSLTVQEGASAMPRSYLEYPSIFPLTLQGQTRYIMYVSTPYQGEGFVPEDAKKLTGVEANKIAYILFGGGWGGAAPIVDRPKTGTKLPSDYCPKKTNKNTVVKVPTAKYTYVLSGPALEALKEYKNAQAEASQAFNSLIDRIDQIIAEIMAGAGQDYETGKLGIIFSRAKLAEANETSGMEVNLHNDARLSDNVHFRVQGHSTTRSQMLMFRNDTKEGRAFQSLFSELKDPKLETFLNLGDQRVNHFDCGKYQILKSTSRLLDRGEGINGLSGHIADWLIADMQDRRMGITPPEMPKAMKDVLDAAFEQHQQHDKQPVKKTSPKP